MQLVRVDLLWTLLIYCCVVHVHVQCEQPLRSLEIKGDQPLRSLEIKGDCLSASKWISLHNLISLNSHSGPGSLHLYCLNDEENKSYLVYLERRHVDKRNCPYLNGPHKYYDQRQCEEKDGTCPEEEYSLGNNMYNFSACFPSPTSPEPTGDDKGIDCDCATCMTLGIIVLCIIVLCIIGVAICIIIGSKNTFIQGKYQQMKKCCCEQTQMLGSSGTSSDLQVDIRDEDEEGRALAKTQPAGGRTGISTYCNISSQAVEGFRLRLGSLYHYRI